MPSYAATRQVFPGQEVFTAFPLVSSRRLLCRKIVDSCPVAFQGCFQPVSRETATCVFLWLRGDKSVPFLCITPYVLGGTSYAFAQASSLLKGCPGPHCLKQCSLIPSFLFLCQLQFFLTFFLVDIMLRMFLFIVCFSHKHIILFTDLSAESKTELTHSRCSIKTLLIAC